MHARDHQAIWRLESVIGTYSSFVYLKCWHMSCLVIYKDQNPLSLSKHVNCWLIRMNSIEQQTRR